MPMKQTGRKTYKTMQGKQIDMDLLRQRNELTPAVGNVKVNARGDELGKGGKIIRSREQVLKDYYDAQKSMPDEVVLKDESEFNEQPTAAPEPKPAPAPKPAPKPVAKTTPKKDENWVEDADGNFVAKDEK